MISNSCENAEALIKHSATNLHDIIYSKHWGNICCNELVKFQSNLISSDLHNNTLFQIESFSLEILDERRWRISALGYFDINYGSFARVISNITIKLFL